MEINFKSSSLAKELNSDKKMRKKHGAKRSELIQQRLFELDAALKRAREVQAAGEPYLLDVHITNVGPGADQSWYKAFKIAGI